MQHGIVEELGRIPMAPNLAATLVRAAETARSQSAPAVTLEHLLLALTDDPDAGIILQISNIDATRLRNDLFAQLAATATAPPAGAPGDAVISQDLRRVLEASAAAAQQGRRREINGAIVLAAIVGDGRSVAAQMLRAHGMTFEDAIKALQRAVQTQAARPPAAPPQPQTAAAATEAPAPAGPHHAPASAAPASGQSTEELLATVRERIGGPHPARPQPPTRDMEVPTTRPPPQIFAPPPPPSAPQPAAPYEPQWEAAALPPAMGTAPPVPSAHPQRPQAPGTPHPGSPAPQGPGPQAQPGPEAVPRTQPPRPAPPPMPAGRAAPPPMPESARPAPAPPWPEPASPEPSRRPQPSGSLPPPMAMPGSFDGPAQSARPAGGRLPAPTVARTGPAPQQQAGAQADRRPPPPGVEPGQLVENIPRKMRSGVASPVEVRIGRDRIQGLAKGMPGQVTQHAVQVTRAMSVRLRAPDGGFFIETASPETQWIDNTLGVHADDFASWRWTVTPKARGTRRLQLVISARTVGPDGLAAETALPEQVVDVKVSVNYATAAKRIAGWLVATVLGGTLAKFGEGGLDAARALLKSLGAG